MTASACAPYPWLQLSVMLTKGGTVYPSPGFVNLIPIKLPVCWANASPTKDPMIGSAKVPCPSDPNTFICIPLQSNGGPV